MITLDVNFYDDDEASLFRESGVFDQLEGLIENGMTIDPRELLSRSMFMEQKDEPGWRTRTELQNRCLGRIAQFEDYYDVGSGTLVARFPSGQMGTENIERMGVASAIAAMDTAFGTHKADWERLLVSVEKDLDFQVASTGEHYIVVEAKGSVVDRVDVKMQSIPKHKKSIKAKKQVQRKRRPQDILIGTITAITRKPDVHSRIWLIDPPLPRPFDDPFRFKLLARLRFYGKLIAHIGRHHMLVALATRIRALEQLHDVSVLDRAPLFRIDGEPFDVPTSFFTARSHSVDQRFVGFTRFHRGRLRFVGFDTDVIIVLVNQDQSAITEWRVHQPERKLVEIRTLLKKEEAEEAGIRDEGDRYNDVYSWYHLQWDCYLTASGVVIGEWKNEDNDWEKRNTGDLT